jgi:hypothetical protein
VPANPGTKTAIIAPFFDDARDEFTFSPKHARFF